MTALEEYKYLMTDLMLHLAGYGVSYMSLLNRTCDPHVLKEFDIKQAEIARYIMDRYSLDDEAISQLSRSFIEDIEDMVSQYVIDTWTKGFCQSCPIQ